ncbi:MAG: C25 family cysteine peptidase [Candidatus Sumerlaeaceae bacterium]|nr:C25 family cysteine peptidase [Candidatus Sumerlaeaceae bacterium]
MKSGRPANGTSPGCRIVALVLAVLLVRLYGPAVAAPTPFPLGDLRVLTDGATSGVLRLRFENLNPNPALDRRNESRRFLLAGASGRQPSLRITGARFLRARRGQIVEVFNSVPPSPYGEVSDYQVARINPVGRFRQYQLYAVQVSTIIPLAIPGTPESWIAEFIELEADLGPPPDGTRESLAAAQAMREPLDAMGEPIAPLVGALLLNPQIDPAYYSVEPQKDWSEERAWARRVNRALENGPVSKITVYQPGVYALTREWLERQTGSAYAEDTTAGAMSNWRLFRGGREVPLMTTDTPESGSVALFVAQDYDTIHQGPDFYYLLTAPDDSDPSPPLRLNPDSAPSLRATAATTATTARFRIVTEKQVDYHPRLRPTADVTSWFWAKAGDRKIAPLGVELPAAFDPALTTGLVDVKVYAGCGEPMNSQPEIELIINGHSAGVVTATLTFGNLDFKVEAERLRAGHNDVGLRVAYPEGAREKPDVCFQRIVWSWNQVLPDAKRLDAAFQTDPSTTGPVLLGVPAGRARLERPLLWRLGASSGAMEAAISRDGTMLWFEDQASTKGPYRLLAPGAAPLPAAARAMAAMQLFDLHPPCDYLAVAHDSLLEALRPLLNYRQSQGWRTAAVDVDTVFDHFSYGVRTATGLQSFLTYAFYRWPQPKLRHVLLVGEASEYRGDPALAPEGAMANLVPVWGGPRLADVRGDHQYTAVAGTDVISDLAVGRISVATPDDLTTVIRKIIRYESEPDGEWLLRSLFVFDDNDEFPEVVNSVISSSRAPWAEPVRFAQSDYPYEPNTRVPFRRRSHAATAALLDAFHRGAATVNFFGHGGPNLWTHERLLHIMDLPLLNNSARLPFVSCASCDNAWIDYPVAPVQVSMGELFIKMRAGGIGVFAPVSGASPYEHKTLMTMLMAGVWRKGLRTLGDLAMFAKNMYYAETQSPSICEQYVLLGDPATRLAMPRIEDGLEVYPPVVAPGSRRGLTISLRPPPTGVSDARLQVRALTDSAELADIPLILKQPLRVTVDFPVEGPHAAILSYRKVGVLHVHAGRFEVAAPRLVATARLGATCPVVSDAVEVTGTLTANNVSPAPTGPFALRAIFHGEGDEGRPFLNRLLADHLDLAGGGARAYEWRMPAHLLAPLTVSWAGGSLGTGAANDLLPYLFRENRTSQALALMPQRTAVEPSPLSTIDLPRFLFEVWNTGTDEVNEAEVVVLQDGEPLADASAIRQIQPGQKRDVVVAGRSMLPEGRHKLTAEVRLRDREATAGPPRVVWREPLEVRVVPGPNLAFVDGSIRIVNPAGGPLIARRTIEVSAEVINTGQAPMPRVPLHLLLDDPATGREAPTINDMTSQLLGEFAPGQRRRVVFRYDDNNQSGGVTPMWLTVNRHRSLRETSYDDNTVTVPLTPIEQPANYVVTSLSMEPRMVRPGDIMRLALTAKNDGPSTRTRVDIECGLRNAEGDKRVPRRLMADTLGPGEERAFETTVPATGDMQIVYATINASKELDELTYGDNNLEVPLVWIRSVDSLPVASDGVRSLRTTLADASVANMERLPGGSIRTLDKITSPLPNIILSKSHYVSGVLQTTATGDAVWQDNAWSLDSWLLAAGPSEKPGPIRLRVPGALDEPGLQHDVYVLLRSATAFQGGRLGPVAVRIEDEPSSRTLYPPMTTAQPADALMYAGRHDLRDGHLDIEFEPIPGFYCYVLYFDLRPAVSEVVSCVYETSSAAALHLMPVLEGAEPGQVSLFYRILGKNGQWGDWSVPLHDRLELPADTRTFQWRLRIQSLMGHGGVTVHDVLAKNGEPHADFR